MEDNRLIETEEDQEDFGDEEDEFEEEEELTELIPVARMIPRGSIEGEDYDDEDEDEDDDDDYEDYDDDEEDYEEEEVDDLILVDLASANVSSSIADGGTLQGASLISNGLLDDSNNVDSCEGKPGNQEIDGGKEVLSRGEIGGLFCPLCFKAWTNDGEHRICCLPCGHLYGLSCIKKWLQLRPNSGKCPQCNSLCTLKDVRVLYTAGLCIADEKLLKKVRSLKAKCARLEQQVQMHRGSSSNASDPNAPNFEYQRIQQQKIDLKKFGLEIKKLVKIIDFDGSQFEGQARERLRQAKYDAVMKLAEL